MKNNQIVSSIDYIANDQDYEKARADLNISSSGVDMSSLISNNQCCGGKCKRKN